MNAVVTMRKLKVPMAGYCGNFNCNSTDDTFEELQRKGLARPMVGMEYGLFRNLDAPPRSKIRGAGSPPRIEDCQGPKLQAAAGQCRHLAGALKADCIFDVCAAKPPGDGAGRADE